MGWRNVHIGEEGDNVAISNVKLWQNEWRWIGAKTLMLPNPLEPAETLSYMICEVGSVRNTVRFAAGKLPSQLWAFYVPY
ncbi:hypothetical protein AB2M62_11720 [Sphingomonas sp. MMS12-HWE2-04]|uniref:hypothetical protein n=1 Tax=Sphingomonas sp. MMS12-HWE2-04 TaxID=3234199 RepID=UPI003850B862